jgi:hypothetical protein
MFRKPFNGYHMVVTAPGFGSYTQDVDVRSSVPVSVPVTLKVGAASTSVTVEANGGDLVENESTFHTDVDRNLFDKLPLESASSSVSSLVTLVTPGVAADSNGLFHGLGDHAENSFSVDGQPITDQQSKVFSNQIPSDSIQSLEVISGAPPAEFGGKTSLVIKVTTRSGLGVTTPHGNVTGSYGSFGTHRRSRLCVRKPEVGQLHCRERPEQRPIPRSPGTSRATRQRQRRERVRPRGLPNYPSGCDPSERRLFAFVVSKSQHLGPNVAYLQRGVHLQCGRGCRQPREWRSLGPHRSAVKDRHVQHRADLDAAIGSNAVFTFGGFVRKDQFNYYPSADPFADFSPGLQAQTIIQDRKLTNAGVRTDISYVKGIHNIKAGVTYQHTFITENDTLATVDPGFSALFNQLDAAGNPIPNPAGGNFNCGNPLSPLEVRPCQTLASVDLTQGGTPFLFHGHGDIKETGLYLQDTITKGGWSFNVGIRGDIYNGFVSDGQAEPRAGIAYNIKRTNTVLRVSYARSLENPFNENLAIANTGCSIPVIAVLVPPPNVPCVSGLIRPGWRNEFHAGLQQAFGKYLVVDAEYLWKYTHGGYDFGVVAATPIAFPIEWHNSKIPGYAVRVTSPDCL